MSIKTLVTLCVVLGLAAIGYGVHGFVHEEFTVGSLTFLAGILILSFVVNSM